MKLREMLEKPEARRTFHPIQTREAVIAYFVRHKTIERVRLCAPLPSAA